MSDPLEIALFIIITFVVLSILSLLLASVLRRVLRGRMYEELDRCREFYGNRIKEALETRTISRKVESLIAPPGSVKWQAVEEILLDLTTRARYSRDVNTLLDDLGYREYYEKKADSGNRITRASAIDKLGKISATSSVEKLLSYLGSEEEEIVTVTVRALSKIGSERALKGILMQFPRLVRKPLITRKSVETSLINFGMAAEGELIGYAEKQSHPWIKAIILEVLSQLKSNRAVPLAVINLDHPHSEVRAKALKLIGSAAGEPEEFNKEKLVPLLDDPAWFVRLRAVQALGNLGYVEMADRVGDKLLDTNWQVRNAAATALTKFKEKGLEVFLKILRSEDRYAKESICEEIEKTGLNRVLVENLGTGSGPRYEESKEILEIMCSLNFRTRCSEYLEAGEEGKIREELLNLLKGPA